MREVQSMEDFEHLHGDALKDLIIQVQAFAQEPNEPTLTAFDDDLSAVLGTIIKDLQRNERPEPNAVLRTALSGMEAVDRKRFVLENLLESAKKGQPVAATLERFKSLGLLSDAANTPAATSSGKRVPPAPSPRLGLALLRRKGFLKAFFLSLAQIGANAFVSIPKFVSIEPQINLFPVPGLSFALKGKGMSLHDLFQVLNAPGRFVGPSQ